MKDNKHKNQDTQTQQNNEHEPKVKKEPKVDFKKEIEQLKNEIKKQQDIIDNLKSKNILLELEIKKVNDDFIKQLEIKSKQAQEILEQKTNELEQKHDQKVNDAVFKVYKYKMEPLLDAINHFTKIVNQDYEDPKVQAFVYGFKMFAQNMVDGLENLKITKITPKAGDLLNDDTMEVFEVVENTNLPSMQVLEVVHDGFKFEDKVIKFASVKVAK